jgi:hypothetical protein
MKLPGFPKSQRPVYNPRMNRTDRIPAMSLAEAAAALLGLTLLAAAQLIAARCTDLLSHPLWLDEVITARLVNDPSFTHMFKALASGVDTQPPVFYLLVWPIARVAGSLDNVALRAISLGSVLLGMVGAYAICRRYFGRTASAIAMLALWAHPMVIDQAFQARFYGPWLALTIWFCYLQLGADGETRAHRVARWIIAILAATMHYFGAISVGLIMLTDLLVHRRFKRIIPGIAALAAILLCAVLVFQQRRGLSVPTWIEPLSASQIKDVIYAMFGAPSLALVLLMMWLTRLLRRPKPASPAPQQRPLMELLPLTSLLLLPLVIIAFSIIVQPSLVLRYLTLAVAPLAPLAAALAEPLGRRLAALTIIGLVGLGAASMKMKQHATRGYDDEYAAILDAIDTQVPPDATIVFKRRLDYYPVLQLRPQLAARAAQLYIDDAALPNASSMFRFERDMGRKVEAFYPDFKTRRLAELQPPFYLVAYDNELDELMPALTGLNVSNPHSRVHEVERDF